MSYTSNFCNFILNQLTYASSLKLKSHYKMCKGMCGGNQKALATSKLFFGLQSKLTLAKPKLFTYSQANCETNGNPDSDL